MAERLSENDPNSFSCPEDCAVIEIDFNLEVNFKKHILEGYVDLSVERKNTKADLFLDTKLLTIKSIKNKNTKSNINFVLHDQVEPFGSKLEIKLPKRGSKFVIRIEYETSPNASSLSWLEPEQTADKKQPYMFSMNQAIHARSMFPCQDTPNVKTPYTATITAPYELTVLMSALRDGEEMDDDPMMKRYKFVQKVPVQSYLIAMAVGAIESRKIGPRSHVWSEKSVVDKAAEEFSETEAMLTTAESLLGPYEWEIYDILVLPPFYAFGGMENPCLTFVTPTLLVGDKSQANVIAHEISHSWSGNLVTNKNFEHFWLNEGFTTFFERKINGRMMGEQSRQARAIDGWMELEYDVSYFGEQSEFTKLVPDLTGHDPDEAFNTTPYEKGHTLLFYLETLFGIDEFEKFLKSYIQKFKGQSIDTDTWKSYLYEYFSDKQDILDKVDWKAWLHAPGMPPVKPEYDCTQSQKCIDLSKRWAEASDSELDQFKPEDIEQFSPYQLINFLSFLLNEKPLSVPKLEKLQAAYDLNNNKNSEIKFRWIRLGLVGHWKETIPSAIDFITQQGRLKYVSPIYVDLYKWEETREQAISTFQEYRNRYMYPVVQRIGKDLGVIKDEDK